MVCTISTFQGYFFFHVTMVTDATKCWTQFWVYITININKIFWKTCITQPFLTVNDSNTYFAPSQSTVTNPILKSKLYHRSWKSTYHFNHFLTLIMSSIHKRMRQQILCRWPFLMNTFKCQSKKVFSIIWCTVRKSKPGKLRCRYLINCGHSFEISPWRLLC